MALRRLSIAIAVALIAACGGSPSEPEPISLDGTWAGDASGLHISMTVTEIDGTVVGSATLTAFGASHGRPVTGTLEGAVLKFSMAGGTEPIRFSGTVEGKNKIPGTLSAWGLSNMRITFTRQQ